MNKSIVKDSIGFVVLGIICFLYSVFARHFAQLHFNLPWLNIPIFVGEILFFFCGILFAIQKSSLLKSFRSQHVILYIYAAWIVFRAVSGWVEYGPLALRMSAMFYYPFFIIFGMAFYEKKVFTQKNTLTCLIFLLISFVTRPLYINYTYYFYAYSVVFFILVRHLLNRNLRLTFLLLLILQLPFQSFFIGSRSNILAELFAFAFMLLYFCFFHIHIQKKYRVFIFTLIGVVIIFLVVFFGPHTKVKSLLKYSQVVQMFNEADEYIQEEIKTYEPVDLKAKLFAQENEKLFNDKTEEEHSLDMKGKLVEQLKIWIDENHDLMIENKPSGISNQEYEEELLSLMTADLMKAADDLNRFNTQDNMDKEQMVMYARSRIVSSISRIFGDKLRLEDEGEITTKLLAGSIAVYSENQNKKLAFYDNELNSGLMNREYRILNVFHDYILGNKRTVSVEHANILFRLFIWRDMISDVINEKAWTGVSWGRPQRSPSVEILGIAKGEWVRDGWVTPHNSYFHIFYRSGLIGVLLILTLFAGLLRLIILAFRFRSVTAVLLISILIYWFIMAFFLIILEVPYTAIPIWTLFGCIIAYLNEKKNSLTLT